MSRYVISDIHGNAERFHKMLDEINIDFSKDILYINGDIVDRGKNSLKLLFEIIDLKIKYGNHVVLIKGNHEHFLERYVYGILPRTYVATFRPLDEKIYASRGYGGADTIREVKALDDTDKQLILKYIHEFESYVVVDSPKRGKMVIVHSGLHYDHIVMNEDRSINVIESIEEGLSANENDFLISGFLQREAPAWVTKSLDKVMVVGHTPTIFLEDVQMPIITMKPGERIIMTDCGCGYPGGRLGCLRIDDERTYYVD